MPIEIKELQIVTVVSGDSDNKGNKTSEGHAADQQEKIIAACVEQVLEILQQKNER